jgi:hypothetical protein
MDMGQKVPFPVTKISRHANQFTEPKQQHLTFESSLVSEYTARLLKETGIE